MTPNGRQKQTAFQIDVRDTVATALSALSAGRVDILGDAGAASVAVLEDIPAGHKIAVRDISAGDDIVKYGVPIGVATAPIQCGTWVHLHCMGSKYDEKSNHFDPITGTATDTEY
jgi:Altronate dehydratase